jgi:hypothetical protein
MHSIFFCQNSHFRLFCGGRPVGSLSPPPSKKGGIRSNQRDPEGLPTHELGCAISATMSRWKFLRAQFPACGGSLLTIPLDLSTSEERPNGDQGFAETLRLHPCMDPLRATGRPRTPPSQTRITERHLSAPGDTVAAAWESLWWFTWKLSPVFSSKPL